MKSLLQQNFSTLGTTDKNNPWRFSSVSSYVFLCFAFLTGFFQYTEYQGQHWFLTEVNVWGVTQCLLSRRGNKLSFLMNVSNLSDTRNWFKVWSWGALCIKQPGDHRAKVGLSNHLSDVISVTWWTLLRWRSVACVLWSVPLRDTIKGQEQEMNHHMMWRIKGNFSLFLLDEEIWGPAEKPCARSVMVSWVKSECLNFAKVRETWNKHCSKYSKPLCCSHKGWIAFRSQEG